MLRAWGVVLWAALLAAGCGGGGGGGSEGGGTGPDAVALDRDLPSVTYVTPSNGASDVGTNARLTVSFSEPMDESSLAQALRARRRESRGTSMTRAPFHGAAFAALKTAGAGHPHN